MKSIHRDEFALFTQLLREVRQEAGHTQISISAALGRPQNVISTIERGKLRLDFLQLRDWCRACNTTLIALATRFEERLAEQEAATAGQRRPGKKDSSAGVSPSAAKRASKSVTKASRVKP